MILDLLESADPSQAAIRTEAHAVSYGNLISQVEELANELRRLGLSNDDRIAMALPNGLEVISLFLAASTVATARS